MAPKAEAGPPYARFLPLRLPNRLQSPFLLLPRISSLSPLTPPPHRPPSHSLFLFVGTTSAYRLISPPELLVRRIRPRPGQRRSSDLPLPLRSFPQTPSGYSVPKRGRGKTYEDLEVRGRLCVCVCKTEKLGTVHA